MPQAVGVGSNAFTAPIIPIAAGVYWIAFNFDQAVLVPTDAGFQNRAYLIHGLGSPWPDPISVTGIVTTTKPTNVWMTVAD